MTQINKNRLLVVAFLLVAIVGYRFAFSMTLDAKTQFNELESKVLGFKNLARLSSNLKAKEKYLDSILDKNNLRNTSVQNNLLDFLNRESAGGSVKIVEFNRPHISNDRGIGVVSYQFTLTGSFNELERILFELEQKTGYGKVSHVAFEKKRDFRKRKDFLYARVIVENYDSE